MGIKSKILAATALVLSTGVNAGIITGGTYLDNSGANQLEAWLGVGDQDFTNVWSGGIGATASDFHSAVDGVGPTFSIYEMTIYDGSSAYIGGYTNLSWAGNAYKFDADAFIFNLSSGEVQRQIDGDGTFYGLYSISAAAEFFPTFGGGWDIFGGFGTLGTGDSIYDGYTFSYTYQTSLGQISVDGDAGYGDGDSGYASTLPVITGLQVFTLDQAAVVPVPAAVWLFGSGLVGLIGVARRKA